VTADDHPKTETPRLDPRQLLTLLGWWAGAVLVPGIIAIPWAGRGREEFQIPAYVLWGLGYLAQMVIFAVVAKITRTTELWAWLVASVLPWMVDLISPDNPMYISVFILAVGLFAAWIYLRSMAADRLLHDGIPGTGTVLGVIEPRFASLAVNNGYIRRSVRVSVSRPDKALEYDAVLRDLFREDELPKPGDTIELRVDPEDAMRIAWYQQPSAKEPADRAAVEASAETDSADDPHDSPKTEGTAS
jgi:hypothetical protein